MCCSHYYGTALSCLVGTSERAGLNPPPVRAFACVRLRRVALLCPWSLGGNHRGLEMTMIPSATALRALLPIRVGGRAPVFLLSHDQASLKRDDRRLALGIYTNTTVSLIRQSTSKLQGPGGSGIGQRLRPGPVPFPKGDARPRRKDAP